MLKSGGFYVQFYVQLMRLDKPVGIFLLLFPTLSALYIAAVEYNIKLNFKPSNAIKNMLQNIDIQLWCIFIVASICMRSAGCVINDYFDKNFDINVARTHNRPLVLQPNLAKHALYLSIVLVLICALLAYFFLNRQTLLWGAFACILAATYPLFKRFFSAPQAYLGIAFSMGIPIAYVAQNIPLTYITAALFFANLLLVFAYDTAYAMVDQQDDIKIGMHTSAILLGKYAPLAVLVCTAIYWLIFVYIGYILKANILFWVLCALGMLKIIVYDYSRLYKNTADNIDNTTKYFKVFKSYQYVVLCSFLASLFI